MKRVLPVLVPLCLVAACIGKPGLDDLTPDPATLGQGLPKGFRMGAATSSHQIEGGLSNDWTDWEDGGFPDGTPHIKNNDQSGAAADSWNRFDEDLALLQQLGATTYRMSVEWSRIEPTKGQFDDAVLAAYKDQVTKLRAAGIEPMVTLFHFTLPKWAAAKGGFENAEVSDDFADFSRRVAQELGGQVDLWCPINEINVYALQGYLEGIWPPGVKGDTTRQTHVMANLFKAHGKVAKVLREVDTVDADGDGKATLITTAHHVRLFQPASHAPLDVFISGITDDYFNESTPRALKTGHIKLFIPGTIDLDEQVPELVDSIDVLGVNYYSRSFIRADLGDPSLSQQYYGPGRPKNDLDWDVFPDGMYQSLVRFKSYGLPIYITENGMADNDGQQRSDFLLRHLDGVRRAVRDGADVRGYYHWSLLDNFEWAEGFEPRFGLFHVDFGSASFTRTATPAVQTFRTIADNIPK